MMTTTTGEDVGTTKGLVDMAPKSILLDGTIRLIDAVFGTVRQQHGPMSDLQVASPSDDAPSHHVPG